MAVAPPLHTFLFGGDKPWNPNNWTSSDDRVRNGSSISYLTLSPHLQTAEFHGNLNITTLGGAGFASQRTTGDWDLSGHEGMELDIAKSDEKRYTLTLKDQVLPRSADGREQATVSWEYDFTAQDGEKVFLAWGDLKATYRGRAVEDPEPLRLESVRGISLMMRSFFGTQEGDFSMTVASISATNSTNANSRYRDDPNEKAVRSPSIDEKSQRVINKPKQQSWLGWLRHCLF